MVYANQAILGSTGKQWSGTAYLSAVTNAITTTLSEVLLEELTKITQRKGVTSLTSSALLTPFDLHGLSCDLPEMPSPHLYILEQHKYSTSKSHNFHEFICVTKYL